MITATNKKIKPPLQRWLSTTNTIGIVMDSIAKKKLIKDEIPEAMHACRTWLNWMVFDKKRGEKVQPYKSAIPKNGKFTVDPLSEANWVSLDEAIKRANADSDVQVGISLTRDGLRISDSYLWCFDFDGFSNDGNDDEGTVEFARKVRTYTEISPSGTGFKMFFLSDKAPVEDIKIQFAPSKFAALYPDVRKYRERAVEVFSQRRFLATTGNRYFEDGLQLRRIPEIELGSLLQELDQWAKRDGGTGVASTATTSNKVNAIEAPINGANSDYGKLTDISLKAVLAKINHHDEQLWSGVCNALARAYGESGRNYFMRWSKDGYGRGEYPRFCGIEANTRFDRALSEVASRAGYGCKHLCVLAGVDPARTELWESTLNFTCKADFNDIGVNSAVSGKQLSILDPNDKQEIAARFTLRTLRELLALPSMAWRVKKILPKSGLSAIYGASGSGKSFLVIDLLARVSLGMDFYGHKTSPCPVIYVCLEGTGGVSKRMQAWEQHHNKVIPNTFRVMTDSFSLMNHESQVLGAVLEQHGLTNGIIVIDTLNQSAPTADENTSADMGTIITNAMKLQRMTNSLVILVHHTGKDSTRGPRGHSSLYAALDVAIETKRSATGREWALTKAKDAKDSDKHEFCLTQIALGLDADGEAITSCVAELDGQAIFRLPAPKGKNQIVALAALKKNAGVVGLTMSRGQAIEIIKTALTCPSKNKAARAKDAVEGLIVSGYLREEGDAITLSS